MGIVSKLFYKKENAKLERLIYSNNLQVFENGLFIREGQDELAVSLSEGYLVFRMAFDQNKFNKWDPFAEVFVDEADKIKVLIKGVEFPRGIDINVIKQEKGRYKDLLFATR